MIPTDDILTPEEVERFTGLPRARHQAQANLLRREGIRCVVNARKEVIVTWSWIRAAAGEVEAETDSEVDSPDFSTLKQKHCA